MDDENIAPVDGATWVEPYERDGVKVRGYWRLPNGGMLDPDAAEEIITLKHANANKDSLPSESLKKGRKHVSSRIDPTDVSSIIDKGKQLESEFGIDPSEYPDVQADRLALKLGDWMSTHAKSGNGELVRNAVGRYAKELNESIAVLPNNVKNHDNPGSFLLIDSTQGSKISHAMNRDTAGYFYSGAVSLPPATIDTRISSLRKDQYEDKKMEFMEKAKIGSVIIEWSSYDGKEGFENGSKGATALMKIDSNTVRKVVLGRKFSMGKGSSLKKIANEADVIVQGYSEGEEHVKAPVYEVKERREAFGSAIIVRKPSGKEDEGFKQVLMHEYVHGLSESFPEFRKAAEEAYARFDEGVDTDKHSSIGIVHRGFGSDAMDYGSTGPGEFMSEASSMLFHPSGMCNLMNGRHASSDERGNTDRVRQWALGFWAGVADGSIEV